MSNMVKTFNGVPVPAGEKITFSADGAPIVPDRPIVPYIAGDGIGDEIMDPVRRIVDAAVKLVYGDKKQIVWFEAYAGDKAVKLFGTPLPDDTKAALDEFGIGIKGPLATPSSGGMRSLNVALRKHGDYYQCVRPVRYYTGVPSPVRRPQDMDVVIFRENGGTDDLYAGIEFEMGSAEALEIIALLRKMGFEVSDDSGIGIKPISRRACRRIVRRAMEFAVKNGRKVVTLVGKGNIQKFTEGAFVAWGFEYAKEAFGEYVITEEDLWSKYGGEIPDGKILVNYRITDAMFAEIVARPGKYSVIATTNMNGDYLSDACAAIVGGLGIAPGANIGDRGALFEATHGTAPDIAGKGLANPSSLLLSAVEMLRYMGWNEPAELIVTALQNTILDKVVTGDMARLMPCVKGVSTTEFANAILADLGKPARHPRVTLRNRIAAALRRYADALDR
jgi:isocitrate dehydrogenase